MNEVKLIIPKKLLMTTSYPGGSGMGGRAQGCFRLMGVVIEYAEEQCVYISLVNIRRIYFK